MRKLAHTASEYRSYVRAVSKGVLRTIGDHTTPDHIAKLVRGFRQVSPWLQTLTGCASILEHSVNADAWLEAGGTASGLSADALVQTMAVEALLADVLTEIGPVLYAA